MVAWLWASFWSGWVLMDFSSPLTDEAGRGSARLRDDFGQPMGVIWTLWLQSRVLRCKEPTLRSQVSDSRRVRKSGDCKPHPSPLPLPLLRHTPRWARHYTGEDICIHLQSFSMFILAIIPTCSTPTLTAALILTLKKTLKILYVIKM